MDTILPPHPTPFTVHRIVIPTLCVHYSLHHVALHTLFNHRLQRIILLFTCIPPPPPYCLTTLTPSPPSPSGVVDQRPEDPDGGSLHLHDRSPFRGNPSTVQHGVDVTREAGGEAGPRELRVPDNHEAYQNIHRVPQGCGWVPGEGREHSGGWEQSEGWGDRVQGE